MKKSGHGRGALYFLVAALLAAALIAVALRGSGGGGKASSAAGQRVARPPAAASRPVSAAQPTSSTSPSFPPPSSYPDQPVSTAGAAQAVRAFMPGFLAWSLGRAPATAIKDATAAFITDARSHPPNVTPAEQHEHDRLLRIAIAGSHPPLAIVAVASSLGAPYTLTFDIVHTAHGWLVSRLEPAH